MNRSIIMFFILISFHVSGQECTFEVIDSQTSRPIAGAEVRKGAEKFITGQNGKLLLNDLTPGTKIIINANGYQKQQVIVDTSRLLRIYLHPLEVNVLDTVVVDGRKKEHPKLLRWKGNFGPLFIFPNKHVVQRFMIPDKLIGKQMLSLEFVIIPFSMNENNWNNKRNNFVFTENNTFQVLIFQDTISKDNLLFQSKTFSVRSSKRRKIKLDLEEENIYLPKGELIIVIRHLGCKPEDINGKPTRCFVFFRSGKKRSVPMPTKTYFVRDLFVKSNNRVPDNTNEITAVITDKYVYMKLKLH